MRSRATAMSWNEVGGPPFILPSSTIKADPSTLRVQRLAHLQRELSGIEWFLEEEGLVIALIAGMERLFEITRDEQHLRVGIGNAKPVRETPAAHLRHDHVGEEKIDPASHVAGDQVLRVVAVRRFNHVVAEIP